MLLDAHAHVDHYSAVDLTAALGEMEQLSILTVSVSMDLASWESNLEIARRSPRVLPAFGIHPWKAPEYVERLGELAAPLAEAPMIGEIGLDYEFVEDASQYTAQRKVFEYFLEAARAQKKIVNVHTKGAEADVLRLLGEHGVERAIVHWYSGPKDTLHALADCGYYFTVGVEVLVSDHIRALAREIPADRLLTETDNPGGQKWLAGYDGMPRLILDVLCALADLRGTSPMPLAETVRANFLRLISDDARLRPFLPALD